MLNEQMRTHAAAAAKEERTLREALARLSALALASGDPADKAARDEVALRLNASHARIPRRLAHAPPLANSTLVLEAVLNSALGLAIELTNAERGFLTLTEGRRIAARHNVDAETLDDVSDESTRAIVEQTIETGEALFASGERQDGRHFACLPLRVRDGAIGAIYLESTLVPTLAARDRTSLIASAHQAALAIENARLFEVERERLQRIATQQAFQTNLLEAIANGVITISPTREITTFNRAAEATFGFDAKRIVGKRAHAIGAMIPEFDELLETFFESGAVHLRAEVEAMKSDGTELTLEIRLAPLEGESGTGVALVVTDVTKHRDLEVAHAAEIAKANRVEATFSRYLAPHVVKSLMDDPGSVRLGGERRRATMLFADVRGFTAMAAKMPADRVVEILNTYFDEAVKIVFAHEGLLDKFYGDGLMAVFGPPRVRGDDAARAVDAAIALHDIVDRLRMRLDYPLRISVGLATGDVVAGHFGSSKRMDYTVIGDAVNLASGLQSMAPAGLIYCDEETMAAAGVLSRPVRGVAVRVKGRDDLVNAFAIYPKPEDAPQEAQV